LLKPGPHQQQWRSNIVEATGNFIACCFDIVAVFGNNVGATFNFVEASFDFVAFDNVASTLLLVWTSFYRYSTAKLTVWLLTALARKVMRSVVSIRLSARLFPLCLMN